MNFPTSLSSQSHEMHLKQLFYAGRHHEVVAQSRSLIDSPEANPLAANIFAASCFYLGDFAKAASVLELIEASMDKDCNYLSLYGATCRRLGLMQRAESLLSRAIELSSGAPEIRNNYANLLIDLGRYKEAQSILEKILHEIPDYLDARSNLNRILFHEQVNEVAPQASTLPKSQEEPVSWTPTDPLMLAFSEDEVRQAGGVKFGKPSPSAEKLLSTLPSPQEKGVAADKLRLATDAITEGDFKFALQLCSQALAGLGANASIYVNAGDAYINLQRFHQAEICILHSLQIGGANINHYINLATFASLRGDIVLANHYLDQAAGLDPSHPNLSQMRTNISNRKIQLAGSKYSFECDWSEEKLQRKE